jgi:hypothetical protein
MSELSLSATQQTVMALMASGSTARAAAAAAGVHRNTIANWLCSSEFRQALALAQYERTVNLHQKAESLADEAFSWVQAFIADPQVPAAVRLKAALAVIDRAAAPLPEPPAAIAEIMHKNAQSEPAVDCATALLPESCTEIPEIVHKKAQPEPATIAPIRNATPKIGRNELCPCGSGLKFKRCCLGKSAPPAPPSLSTAA